MRTYNTNHFEVVNNKGVLQATFLRRWQAEEFAKKYNCIVVNVEEEYGHFADDEEKMADFKILTKEEFLASYSYLTEKDYDLTVEFCKNNGL